MIKTIFIFLLLGTLTYTTIPTVQENVDNSLDIFISGGKKTSGSNIELRERQLLGAYKYFIQSPIRGNGYDYINKELGWEDKNNAVLDADMCGYESIIYQIMIQQGLIGLITKLIFFISIIIFFLKTRRQLMNKSLANLGLSIAFLFLAFSIGTGPLGAWPLTMLLLGAIIKTIQLNNVKYTSS